MLVDRLRQEGRQLFARRGVVPLALLPILWLAMPAAQQAEADFGPTASGVIQWAAFGIALSGFALRCVTIAFAPDGTSSRDTHRLRATSLSSTGVYSVVRHPLYVGNGLMWIGVAASLRVWWIVAIIGLIYWLYIERVMLAEEAFLEETFGDRFRQWSARTPAFVPRLSGWVPPAGTFSWRRLVTEHNGLLAIAVLFPLLEWIGDMQHGYVPPAPWGAEHAALLVPLAVASVVSIVAIAIKKWP